MKHEILQDLKRVAADLGHAPCVREYYTEKLGRFTKYQVDKHFGSYNRAVEAAGFQPFGTGMRIDNSVFERDIEQHLEKYEPRAAVERKPYPTAAIISDIHLPFVNQRVLDRFHDYVAKHKPEWVIIAGDAWDFLSHSKFPRSHNVFTPRDERAMCIKMNTDLWAKVKAASPKSKCYQLAGNHEARPLKRVLEEYPAAEDWVREMLAKDFSFDGVTTILDARDYLQIDDDIIVMHGFKAGIGGHRDVSGFNVINGHTHVGGVSFRRLNGKTMFELNTGLAGDPEGKGLTYTPSKITTWTAGFGILNEYGPQFVSV